eukprot:1151169-Pelagomonas_calceolata.AAC.2
MAVVAEDQVVEDQEEMDLKAGVEKERVDFGRGAEEREAQGLVGEGRSVIVEKWGRAAAVKVVREEVAREEGQEAWLQANITINSSRNG